MAQKPVDIDRELQVMKKSLTETINTKVEEIKQELQKRSDTQDMRITAQ